MDLNNVPEHIWLIVIGLIVFAMSLWLLLGWGKAESVLYRVCDLITQESPHICGTCFNSFEAITHAEDHNPPWLVQRGAFGTGYISDHEYAPVFLVDIARLTRDPESWEKYGRHLKLRTRI